jgi:uncharacterized protein YdeI (YjbR/CyaY-like superfamily)
MLRNPGAKDFPTLAHLREGRVYDGVPKEDIERLYAAGLAEEFDEDNEDHAASIETYKKQEGKKAVLKSYVKQAIQIEKAGLKVDFKAKRELELPEELTQILRKDRKLAKAFHALTPGRQRGYVLYFKGAKQAQTRSARIKKHAPNILAGRGINDA